VDSTVESRGGHRAIAVEIVGCAILFSRQMDWAIKADSVKSERRRTESSKSPSGRHDFTVRAVGSGTEHLSECQFSIVDRQTGHTPLYLITNAKFGNACATGKRAKRYALSGAKFMIYCQLELPNFAALICAVYTHPVRDTDEQVFLRGRTSERNLLASSD